MLALALATLVLAEQQIENNIVGLTDKSFERLVKGRPNNEVWIVMFGNAEDKDCKKMKVIFRKAADTSYGMVKFGFIDGHRFPDLREEYGVDSLPGFRIFHADGDIEYTGPHKATDFLKGAMVYLKNNYQEITGDWNDNGRFVPAAMLFTDQPKAPGYWTGISSFFVKKPFRIGFSSDVQLAKAFGAKSFPTIIFADGTEKQVYKGAYNFRDLRTSIEKFFEKRVKQANEEDAKADAFFMPDQFATKCYGGKTMCVLVAAPTPPESMFRAQKILEMTRHKVWWFVGNAGLPEKFMERGGAWIYNPRRDGFLHIEDLELIPEGIERIIDGSVRWQKKAALNADKEL